MVEINYGLHEVFEQTLVEKIHESISYEVDMDEFTNDNYRKAALEACIEQIENSLGHGTSLKDISYRIEDRSAEHAEIIASNAEIEMDSQELARVYKQAYDEASVKADEVDRTDHEKAIHLLIEQSIESDSFEKDYDAVFSETFFKDHVYQSKADEYPNLNMNKHREMDEIIGSDADFWRVNLEDEEIDLVEVKTSDKEIKSQNADIEENMDPESVENVDPDLNPDSIDTGDSRRERQVQQFRDAVEHANDQVGTSFDVNKDIVIARDMLDSADEPAHYTGDYQLAEGVEPDNLEKLESFVDELLFDMTMQEADQIEAVSPEEWAESV